LSIRAAYDITFLSWFFDRPGEQSGVYRVVEELFSALCLSKEVELTAVSLSGDDPLTDSIRSRLYLDTRAEKLACDFRHSFRSRLKLTRFYADIFRSFASGEPDRLSHYSPRALYLRRMRGLLYRLIHTYKMDDLRHWIDSDEIDVYHSPFSKLPPRALTGRLPRILTVYDLIFINQPHFMPDHLISFLDKIFKSVEVERDWITSISEFTKQEYCEHTGMSPERVFVTPLAAAPHFHPVSDLNSRAVACRRYGIPDGDYFLGLGVLQPRKNLAHLIRCFFRVIEEQRLPDTYLVLAGAQGWMLDEIFAEAQGIKSGDRSRVILTGHVADEDLASLYSGAIAFVYPSLYEGFGLPPLEAMACGTPVITSNVTALPEVVGDAGLTVSPTDSDALCQAMLDLLRNQGYRQEFSRKGLERAAEFSWERCADATARAYRTAASEGVR
jgi:glycosyltransferase involved in cell wall biosynthesis